MRSTDNVNVLCMSKRMEPDEVQDECHMHDSHYKNTYQAANKQTNAFTQIISKCDVFVSVFAHPSIPYFI